MLPPHRPAARVRQPPWAWLRPRALLRRLRLPRWVRPLLRRRQGVWVARWAAWECRWAAWGLVRRGAAVPVAVRMILGASARWCHAIFRIPRTSPVALTLIGWR